MSTAYTKKQLKASRDAIQSKDWQAAASAADAVLEHEKENYTALVFKALALLNLKAYDNSLAAYRSAIAVQPATPLAWQGLEKFATERKDWSLLEETLRRQLDLFADAGDATKCAEALQRLVILQKEEGSSAQLADALDLYLPPSSYHALLCTLPAPDQSAPTATTTFEAQMNVAVRSLEVLQEVISIRETVEEASVKREVEKRRTRLDSAGKSREALRNEVGVDVWSASQLPALYEQVLAHPQATDELRRESESKLLKHHYALLLALPNVKPQLSGPSGTAAANEKQERADAEAMQRKEQARARVVELARGMVVIGVEEELAWEVMLEWEDQGSLEQLPRERLRSFVYLFPRSGRTAAIRALLLQTGDEQFVADEEEARKIRDIDEGAVDLLTLAIEGLDGAPKSLLTHRVAATMYLLDRDYLSAADVASAGISLARKIEQDTALELLGIKRSLETTLACALTRLHPPQHHVRALRLLNGVIGEEPQNLDALIAKATIDEAAERWDEARATFVRIQQLAPAFPSRLSLSKAPALEAQAEIAWCDVCAGRLSEGKTHLENVIDQLDGAKFADVVERDDKAKAWWRLGQCVWRMEPRDMEAAFTCYITALKRSPGYAPAFTALGFYYEASGRDPARASKCFQKAFELDAREDEAARRLAEGFADEREWDLVDVVAKRTVEGEGGADALSGGAVSQRRHLSRNAWAWKAIGAVELHRGKYEPAIAAFHIALRASPEDSTGWQRLGEAYAASGRHPAALKTFHKALELSKNSWQVRFSVAEVHRELGDLDEALAMLREILNDRQDDVGVRVATAATHLMQAQRELGTGYTLRAEGSLVAVLEHAETVLKAESRLRSAWKIAADAVFELARFGTYSDAQAILDGPVAGLLQLSEAAGVDKSLPNITSVTAAECASAREGDQAFAYVAAYFYKVRLVLQGVEPEASSWADLAVALHELAAGDERQASKEATECIKTALKLEPGNPVFWLTLGNLSFEKNVKLAQHCYVRAIEGSPREAIPWSHLGFLYLYHEDYELANEAFIRAQTLASDLPEAWLGQAYIAKHHKDEGSARILFEHAVDLSESSALEADYGFASGLFTLFGSAHPPAAIYLHSPAFALSAYLARKPSDASVLHLSALFSEKLGEQALAIERIERAAAVLEKQYEANEDAATATKYAIAQGNLGRIRLTSGDFEGAIEALEATLGLLDLGEGDEAAEAILTSAARASVSTNAHLGIALAHHSLGADTDSLNAFQAALDDLNADTAEDPNGMLRAQVSVQMAKVLWSIGGEEDLEAAKSQLLDCIAVAPQSVQAITSLAAIGVLSGDEGLVEAALSEVQDLPRADLRALDPKRDVDFLLSMVSFEKNDTSAALKLLQEAAQVNPPSLAAHLALTEGALRVAAATEAPEDVAVAEAAAQATMNLVEAKDGDETKYEEALRLLSFAKSLSNDETDNAAASSLALRAIHAAPWVTSNWQAAALTHNA